MERRQNFFPDQLVVMILTSHRDKRARLLKVWQTAPTLFGFLVTVLTSHKPTLGRKQMLGYF